MGEAFILLPRRFTVVDEQWTAPGFPASNLAEPQPKLAWKTAIPDQSWFWSFKIDLGADVEIDTAAMLFHAGGINPLWWCWSRTDAAGPFAGWEVADAPLRWPNQPLAAPASAAGQRAHGLVALAQPFVARHLRISIQVDGGAPGWSAGVLTLGRRIQPAWGVDWGHGRRVQDLSDVRELDDGGLAIWRRARVPVWRATFGNLPKPELDVVYALLLEAGTSAPILAVERCDGPYTREAIHYGVIQRLEFDERHDANRSKVELTVREWL